VYLGLASHSGNPKGRPREPSAPPDATRSAFEIVLEKRVTVTQAGVDQELSVPPNKSREEHDPGAVLLEPWAVQAALRRRRKSK
jgi:hypothetical protein